MLTGGGGVKQGDPLPHILFILSLEVMACSIRQSDTVQVIKIKNEEVNISLFADDMSCFLSKNSSYGHLSSSLKCFSKFSGLKLDKERTELFHLRIYNLS